MSLARGPAGTAAERKATLVAASARLRSELRAQLSPAAVRDTQAARLLSSAGALLRRPVVVGAIAVTLLAIGPRRVYRLVRWTALTLPLHPLGRRLIPALGARLLSALTADTPARSR